MKNVINAYRKRYKCVDKKRFAMSLILLVIFTICMSSMCYIQGDYGYSIWFSISIPLSFFIGYSYNVYKNRND
jgi:hypothetical protein